VGTGTQQGSTVSVSTVMVTAGIFTVQLDFGACASCFNGAARFLEIAVKPTGGGSFTALTPRQPVTSTPYAINAAQLGGLAASGYLQNSTSQQASSNFNISGNGTAGGILTGSIINALTQVNINGLRAFTVNGAFNNGVGTVFTASNTFAGDGVGVNTTPSGTLNDSTGKFNSFYGAGAGQTNTTGNQNAFFGTAAGQQNTTGSGNAFFGSTAGSSNTDGVANAFFGYQSGISNTDGVANAFFGYQSGLFNTSGGNAFFGNNAGFRNTTGIGNTFIGASADSSVFNPTGNNNTLLGFSSRVPNGLSNATAIGSRAQVDQNNSLVLGSINGVNSATADTNVGIGTTQPAARLNVNGTSWFQGDSTPLPVTAGKGLAIGFSPPNGNGYIFAFDYATFQPQTLALYSPGGKVGIGTLSPDQTLTVNGGASKPGGGSWATFSDERLKNIHGRYTRGLQAVMQLQPIRFEYKAENALGLRGSGEYIGFSAQAVAGIVPEAVSRSANGYLQINNDPILWTMLNAVKEQQVQIDKQNDTIKRQEAQIEALKKLVCLDHPEAEMCKP
jgi:hypothetical protein